jgi:hypothetical protein
MRASALLVGEVSGVKPDGVARVVGKTATCTCGWTGRRRLALSLARHDAWMHAAMNGCQPGVPFVVPEGD